KDEVVDLHFHRRRLLLRTCYRTLQTFAETCRSQHQCCCYTCNGHTSPPAFTPFLSVSSSNRFLSLATSCSRERRIHHSKRVLPSDVIHIGDPQDAPELLGGHLHRPR